MNIHYTLASPDPGTHRLYVAARFPRGPVELGFPSWAPGSYLMREFARVARDFSATADDGSPVPLVQLARNRWKVEHDGGFTVRYDVYCHEKSVRTPYLDRELAFFLPSNVLVYDLGAREVPHLVEIDVPEGQVGVCPLGPEVRGPARARWEAPDLDTLMDSPISVGPFEHTVHEVDGVAHHHWIEPGHDGDLARIDGDLARIVAAARRLVGGPFPYPRYDFVTLHQAKGHGGLEHKACSVLLKPRRSFADTEGYEEFLTLAAHEHFHAWNVKRIHPDTLGPTFDYLREHHTHDLWWLEGGTVYYEERIVFRAGVLGEDRHLQRLADLARRLDAVPGRRHLSLEESSFNAWVKLYRPGEDTGNSTVSYYLKGAVVIWAMDLEIRHRTGGARSVDDLLRALWERWGRHGHGYPEREALRDVAAELVGGGGDWARWWDHHVRGTGEIALAEALDHAGLDLVWGAAPKGAWLGVGTRGGDRLVVDTVREDGPAAGRLSPGDELLAVDGERVVGGELTTWLQRDQPGARREILVARDGRIRAIQVVFGESPRAELKIDRRPVIDDTRLAIRRAWLTQDGTTS